MPSDLLSVPLGTTLSYSTKFDLKSGGIAGVLQKIHDKVYTSAVSSANVWADVLAGCGVNNGIVYVAQAIKGASAITYVGKTLNTMKQRYPANPTGGLLLVFNAFSAGGADSISFTLYNVSHPCLVEGWCYQLAVNQKLNLANVQDPS